jgi:molybdate transport system ATP-binding protein
VASSLSATVALSRAGGFVLDLELTCPPGITCVMGPSGGGKSTLLALLAGLVKPDRGRISLGDELWFDGTRGVNVPVHRRPLAFVFQGLALFPHLSAAANVEYGMAGLPRAARAQKATALLERVGTAHLADRKPGTLSGGEAQRVALARAIARSPKLMLLDEPLSALDRDLRGQLAALVKELAVELAVPVVYVTHSEREAKVLADHVVRIERGGIVKAGTPAEVLDGS